MDNLHSYLGSQRYALEEIGRERRTKVKKLITGLLIAAVLAGYAYGVWWTVDDYNAGKDVVVSRTYEGRLYLPAEEYETFKEYLADNPQVEISRLEVLSSPNALIDMSLTAPADTIVPYGEITNVRMQTAFTGLWDTAAVIALFSLVVVAPLFLLLTILLGSSED